MENWQLGPTLRLLNIGTLGFSVFGLPTSTICRSYASWAMRECYTSKVLSKQACLIAKIKLEKSVQIEQPFPIFSKIFLDLPQMVGLSFTFLAQRSWVTRYINNHFNKIISILSNQIIMGDRFNWVQSYYVIRVKYPLRRDQNNIKTVDNKN